MSNSFEIFKTMVASTAHCEEYDFDAIRTFPDVFSCTEDDYGMSVYIGHDGVESGLLEGISNLKISEGLKMLILFAIFNQCLWLKLDSDGPIYDKFPTYEW